MIRFPCPHCGEKFKIDDSYAGRSTKCPRCKNRITVPAAGEPQESDAAPSATRPESPPPSPSATRPAAERATPTAPPETAPPAPSAQRPSSVNPQLGSAPPAAPEPAGAPAQPGEPADPLAALAEAASLSETAPDDEPAAEPETTAAAAAALPAAAPTRHRTAALPRVHKPPAEPLDRQTKVMAGVLGGVLAVVLIASVLVQGTTSSTGVDGEIVFKLPDPAGGEKADLSADATSLKAIGDAVSKYVSATGGVYPGHVGELLATSQVKPELFVSVLNKGGTPPSYDGAEDPFGPYRFGDFVFMYANVDGVTLPADAVVAASARGGPAGTRVILTANGNTRIVEHGQFLGIMQQQNLLRSERWGRLPQISPRLFR